MTVIPFRAPDRSHFAATTSPRGCAHARSLADAAALASITVPEDRAAAMPATLTLDLEDGSLACSQAARPGLLATRLFRSEHCGKLRPADRTVAHRIAGLLEHLRAGHPCTAVLTTASQGAFVIEAFLATGADGAASGVLLLRRLRPAPWTVADLTEAFGLTSREAHVVIALLHGLPVPAIAERFGLQRGTVRQYLKAIYCKSGTCNQAQLLAVLNGGRAG